MFNATMIGNLGQDIKKVTRKINGVDTECAVASIADNHGEQTDWVTFTCTRNVDALVEYGKAGRLVAVTMNRLPKTTAVAKDGKVKYLTSAFATGLTFLDASKKSEEENADEALIAALNAPAPAEAPAPADVADIPW